MAWTGANLLLPPQGIEIQILERQAGRPVTIRLSYHRCYFFPPPQTKFKNAGLASNFYFLPLPLQITFHKSFYK
jgi:hypothetical protein